MGYNLGYNDLLLNFGISSVMTTATYFKFGAHTAYREYYQTVQNYLTGVEKYFCTLIFAVFLPYLSTHLH